MMPIAKWAKSQTVRSSACCVFSALPGVLKAEATASGSAKPGAYQLAVGDIDEDGKPDTSRPASKQFNLGSLGTELEVPGEACADRRHSEEFIGVFANHQHHPVISEEGEAVRERHLDPAAEERSADPGGHWIREHIGHI